MGKLRNAIGNLSAALEHGDLLFFDLCTMFQDPAKRWEHLKDVPVSDEGKFPNGSAIQKMLLKLQEHPTVQQARGLLSPGASILIAESHTRELILEKEGFTTQLRGEISDVFDKARQKIIDRQQSVPSIRPDASREALRSLEGGLSLLEDIYGDRLEPMKLEQFVILGSAHILAVISKALRSHSKPSSS